MVDSPWTAGLAGMAAGALSGALGRWSLRKTLNSADAVFYSVFAAGLLGRLAVLVFSVWLLRNEKYIIVLAFALSLIAVQLLFAAVPLKQNGIKRNS
ncbi:MAG TPA: hypothetical protein PKI19_02535 [Elusimicrobiales bacterium]|nr:hypothetical protein [Elusimicrobiales bacterium]